MKRNLSDYVVALSVIVCSVILLAALTMALSGFRLKKPARTLQIDFEDVTGVKLHSEVRYAGAPAGRVIALRHLSRDQRESAANKRNAVRVTVSLVDEIPPLPATAKADLEELQRIIKGLDEVEKNANAVFENAGKFVGNTDKQLQDQMKELRVILLNLKVVSTHAKALIESLAEKPNRIIFSGKGNKLTPESEILKSKEPLPAKRP